LAVPALPAMRTAFGTRLLVLRVDRLPQPLRHWPLPRHIAAHLLRQPCPTKALPTSSVSKRAARARPTALALTYRACARHWCPPRCSPRARAPLRRSDRPLCPSTRAPIKGCREPPVQPSHQQSPSPVSSPPHSPIFAIVAHQF
jgi:hypothetical protein